MEVTMMSLVPTFPCVVYVTFALLFFLWLFKFAFMRPSGTYWTYIQGIVVSNVCSEWLSLRRRRTYKAEIEKKGLPHEISVVLDLADAHSYLLVRALRKSILPVSKISVRLLLVSSSRLSLVGSLSATSVDISSR